MVHKYNQTLWEEGWLPLIRTMFLSAYHWFHRYQSECWLVEKKIQAQDIFGKEGQIRIQKWQSSHPELLNLLLAETENMFICAVYHIQIDIQWHITKASASLLKQQWYVEMTYYKHTHEAVICSQYLQ